MDGVKPETEKRKYILIVEKNVDDRFQTSMLLQRLGYNTFGTSVAAEAVDFMFVAPPAAIIAEAGPASASLVYRLKKSPGFMDIPIIILLTAPDPAMDERVKRGEYAAQMNKPIDAEELGRIVREVIDKTRRHNARIFTRLKAAIDDSYASDKEFVTVLSEHGMFIQTPEPRSINKSISVNFEVNSRAIKVEAMVLYTTEKDAGPFREAGMGVKFTKISEEDRALIKAYILEDISEDAPLKNPQS